MRHDTTTTTATTSAGARTTRRSIFAAGGVYGPYGDDQVSGYRVNETEHRDGGLIDDNTYVGPPQTEEQARPLIALVVGAVAAASSGRPRRRSRACGQRIVEPEPQR